MNICEYYQGNHEYDFFINSWNLFCSLNLDDFLNNYDFTSENDGDRRHKKEHDLMVYFSDNLDEFNYRIIGLAIAIELSLKGIAVNKKISIFKFNGDSTKIPVDDKIKTVGFSYLIANLFSLLSDEDCKKYGGMFRFFKDKRNLFVHLAKKEYRIGNTELINNLKSARDYFDKVILPLKEQASLREVGE